MPKSTCPISVQPYTPKPPDVDVQRYLAILVGVEAVLPSAAPKPPDVNVQRYLAILVGVEATDAPIATNCI